MVSTLGSLTLMAGPLLSTEGCSGTQCEKRARTGSREIEVGSGGRLGPLTFDRPEEPGAGVSPVPLGRCGRDAERAGGLLDREAGEVAELDQLGLGRVL